MSLSRFVLLLVVFVSGCIGYTTREFSAGSISSEHNILVDKDGYFVFEGTRLKISPSNDKIQEIGIFPIPFSHNIDVKKLNYFDVDMMIKVAGNKNSIKLNNVIYIPLGGEKIRPARYFGPYDCTKIVAAKSGLSEKNVDDIPIHLQSDMTNCFRVSYSAETPSASETFYFKLEGAISDGKIIDIPLITFTKEILSHVVAVP